MASNGPFQTNEDDEDRMSDISELSELDPEVMRQLEEDYERDQLGFSPAAGAHDADMDINPGDTSDQNVQKARDRYESIRPRMDKILAAMQAMAERYIEQADGSGSVRARLVRYYEPLPGLHRTAERAYQVINQHNLDIASWAQGSPKRRKAWSIEYGILGNIHTCLCIVDDFIRSGYKHTQLRERLKTAKIELELQTLSPAVQ